MKPLSTTSRELVTELLTHRQRMDADQAERHRDNAKHKRLEAARHLESATKCEGEAQEFDRQAAIFQKYADEAQLAIDETTELMAEAPRL